MDRRKLQEYKERIREYFQGILTFERVQNLLFKLPPEIAHIVALQALSARTKLLREIKIPEAQPIELMGLKFRNRVGVAAGLDKNGEYLEALASLGFGFIEIGTVTPKAQFGNPRPRMFRLPQNQALINRLGFNNKGIDYLIHQIKRHTYQGVLGINIGKNSETPQEYAFADYRYCLLRAYQYADYITINISSPNTEGLRSLQYGNACRNLLTQLKDVQQQLAHKHQRYVPLVVKIAPDIEALDLTELAAIIKESGIDGIIATNTTINREGLLLEQDCEQQGGLSGRPLAPLATRVVAQLRRTLGEKYPIIGVGGIDSADAADAKMAAGADLLQIYTGLVYKGPHLVEELINYFT